MKYYKLTNENCQTEGSTTWGEGITHKATGKGKALCSNDVIHVYDHPLKAAIFNCIHARFTNPVLWECKIKKVVANDQLKIGVKQCTTIKQIPLPKITTVQRVHFAILCALQVYKEESFVKWANSWLSGEDRTGTAARGAWASACAARAAEAAAIAAEGAARSAETAVKDAAIAAETAAGTAAWAAAIAAEAQIDLVSLIKQAIRKEVNK